MYRSRGAQADVPAELTAVSCQLLLLSASTHAQELCGSLELAPTPLMVRAIVWCRQA